MRISDWSSDVCSSDLILQSNKSKQLKIMLEMILRRHLARDASGRHAKDTHAAHRHRGGRRLEPGLTLLVEPAQAATNMFDQPGAAQLRPFLAGGKYVDIAELEQHRLDAAIGGEQPAQHRRALLRIARQQPLALFGGVEQERAAFDHMDLAGAQHGHLDTWQGELIGGGALRRADTRFAIVSTHTLTRP